jgi:hypothetical protein
MSSFPVFALSANESAKSLASLANSPQRDLPLSEDFLAFVKDFRFQPKTTLQTPLPSIASILNRKHHEAYYQDLIIPSSEPSFSLFQNEYDHHSTQTTYNTHVPLKTSTQNTQHQPTQPIHTSNTPTQTTFTVRKSTTEKKKTDSNVITIKITPTTSSTPTSSSTTTTNSTSTSTPATPTCSPTQTTDQSSPSTPKFTSETSTPTTPTTPIAPTSSTSPESPANPTNTNEKKRKRWDDDDMVRAMGLVREKKMSVRGAATHCNVPRSTLWDRLSGRVVHGVDSRKKPRRYDSQRLLKAI